MIPQNNPIQQSISRLTQHQHLRIQYLQEESAAAKDLSNQYNQLANTLKTLPNKFTHSAMIPLGPLAFQRGEIVNTNELLVLLGDNYFLQTTANHARKIVNNRVEYIKNKISNLQQEIEQITQAKSVGHQIFQDKQYNEEGDEIVEIKEEYNEEHEENNPIHSIEEVTKETSSTAGESPSATPSNLVSHATELPSSVVAGLNNISEMSNEEFDEFWAELEELEEDEEAKQTNNIATSNNAKPAIRSPADIFAHMKQAKESNKTASPAAAPVNPSKSVHFNETGRPQQPRSVMNEQAFSGTIVERDVMVEDSAEAAINPAAAAPKISKFKAARMGLHE
jgi:prefoldin alpha subunit